MSNGLRPDLALIADWVAPGAQRARPGLRRRRAARATWQARQGCRGYGVEIDDAQVLACLRDGVNVIQQDLEAGLGMFHAPSFDVRGAVEDPADDAPDRTRAARDERGRPRGHRVASELRSLVAPVGDPARAHAGVRELPYEWYNTPNLHMATVRDFEDLLGRLGLTITGRAFLSDGRPVRWAPALRATQAIYRFRRG